MFNKFDEVLVKHYDGNEFQAEILEEHVPGSGDWLIRPMFAKDCLLTGRIYHERDITPLHRAH